MSGEIGVILGGSPLTSGKVEMTVRPELIEEAARRICRTRGFDPDEIWQFQERWRYFATFAEDALIAVAVFRAAELSR